MASDAERAELRHRAELAGGDDLYDNRSILAVLDALDAAEAERNRLQRGLTLLSQALSHRTTEHIREQYRGNTPEEINAETDMLTAIFAETERLRRVERAAREIANDGCGCVDKDGTCRDKHPEDRGAWCWSCVMAEAMEVHDDE